MSLLLPLLVLPLLSTSSSASPVALPVVRRALNATYASSSNITITAPNITSSTVKLGLAWPNSDYLSMEPFGGGNASWYYAWYPQPIQQALALNISFVPHFWGAKQVDVWTSAVASGWKDTQLTPHKELLFFNEPNEGGQANITAQEAAKLWIEHFEPLRAQGYRLGSAATTSNPNGIKWMNDFLLACNRSCTPDFIALHWYDISADGFETYVKNWHDVFGLPIWITEWAYHNFNDNKNQLSASNISANLGQNLRFLQNADYVERFAYFGAMLDMQGVNPLNALIANPASTSNPNITLSPLGIEYLSGGTIPAPSNFTVPSGVVSKGYTGSGNGTGPSSGGSVGSAGGTTSDASSWRAGDLTRSVLMALLVLSVAAIAW